MSEVTAINENLPKKITYYLTVIVKLKGRLSNK